MEPRAWLTGEAGAHEIVSETDRHGKPLRTVFDRNTGLVRNDPIPTDEELARFYSKDYRVSYKGASLPRKRQALRNFRRVADFVRRNSDVLMKARRVLDLGAGSGEFLFVMKELGKEGRGIEPNVDYSTFSRDAYGIDVKTAHLSADLFEEGGYDFIRLNHVLEHLNDPVHYLEMIGSWLAPGGILYVEVPDIVAYCRYKSKGSMFHYGHIYNFDPWTLRAVAAMAGLEEAPATVERCKDSTGVFLQRGHKVAPEALAKAPDPGRILDAIRQHNANGPAVSLGKKLSAKWSARLNEVIATFGTKTFADIGRRVVRTLRAPA